MRVAQIKHDGSLSKENNLFSYFGQKMFPGGDHICARLWGRDKISVDRAEKGSSQRREMCVSWWHSKCQAKVFGLDPVGNEEPMRNSEWGKVQSH